MDVEEAGQAVGQPHDHVQMSSYECAAWEQSLKRLHDPPFKAPIPMKVRALAARTTESAGGFADRHLPSEQALDIIRKAMDGTLDLTFTPALRSASAEGALSGYQQRYPEIAELDDLKTLDLRHLDAFRRRKGAYVAASAVQGAGTALAVTGTVVATTVSGGVAASTVVGAVAVDTVASLAMMGRSVGSVAVRYGYDVTLPDEELFAMGVLSVGTAGTMQAKHQAVAALSRLTQQMMRQATWKQLNEQVIVRAIARVYQILGIRLTQRRLAQVVPFVGVALNGGLSANMTKQVYQRAEDVYRLRFLSDKYGIDPDDWVSSAVNLDDGSGPVGAIPSVIEVLEEETAAERSESSALDDRVGD